MDQYNENNLCRHRPRSTAWKKGFSRAYLGRENDVLCGRVCVPVQPSVVGLRALKELWVACDETVWRFFVGEYHVGQRPRHLFGSIDLCRTRNAQHKRSRPGTVIFLTLVGVQGIICTMESLSWDVLQHKFTFSLAIKSAVLDEVWRTFEHSRIILEPSVSQGSSVVD